MSAIITETFRKNNALAFLADIADVGNRYYVGLGKSDEWPIKDGLSEDAADYEVASPLGTYADSAEVLNNITTLVGVTPSETSLVIPNIAAKTNRRHKAFNPYDPNCFYQTVVSGVQMYPCYVVVNDNVYLCLKETESPTSPYSLPTGANISRVPFQPGDGSVWIYMYTVEPALPINSTQFVSIPVEPTLNDPETEATIEAGSGNLVYGFTVIDGGAGYTVAPTAEFVTAGNVATALSVTISGGAVTKVFYSGVLSSGSWIKARGYVRITGGDGTGARVYPNIAPPLGFGASPAADLPSWYTGIAVEAVELINDDGAYIPYRQVTIVKNPDYEVGVTDPELSLNGLQRLNFGVTDAPSSVTTGDLMTQAATGAVGIVDYYDATNKYLYYHQTFKTGFVPFNVSTITIGVDPFLPTSVTTSEYVKQTGEVVFAENRKKISRAGGQTEEITIILQF